MSVREEWFDGGTTAAPVLEVRLGAGRVEVRRGESVGVRVEADPSSSGPWWGDVSAILGRVEAHLGGHGGGGAGDTDGAERARRAVEATTVEWSDDQGRLRVVSPTERDLRTVPLVVTLTTPTAPSLQVRAGAADVSAAEAVADVELETTGDVDLAVVAGTATVRCGAGRVRIGTSTGRLHVRGGAGPVTVERIVGPAEITTGAGTVSLAEVHADLAVRLASGSIEIADVAAGDLELSTGAGSVRVGLREGVDAHLDLRSTAGRTRSELPVHTQRRRHTDGATEAATTDPVHIRARTSAGEVTVGPAG